VVVPRDEERDPLVRGGEAKLQLHLELGRDRRQPGLEQLALARELSEMELHPQEEAPTLGIGRMLVGVDDVCTGFGEAGRERRDDPVPVRARDDQARDVGVLHGRSRAV
jgi:hypothetical protein